MSMSWSMRIPWHGGRHKAKYIVDFNVVRTEQTFQLLHTLSKVIPKDSVAVLTQKATIDMLLLVYIRPSRGSDICDKAQH